ncbi:MAG: hypothetical protein AB7G93_14155 [Bdellovibrionales bacterium]
MVHGWKAITISVLMLIESGASAQSPSCVDIYRQASERYTHEVTRLAYHQGHRANARFYSDLGATALGVCLLLTLPTVLGTGGCVLFPGSFTAIATSKYEYHDGAIATIQRLGEAHLFYHLYLDYIAGSDDRVTQTLAGMKRLPANLRLAEEDLPALVAALGSGALCKDGHSLSFIEIVEDLGH